MAAVNNYELSLVDDPMKDNSGKEIPANLQQVSASKELLDRYLQSQVESLPSYDFNNNVSEEVADNDKPEESKIVRSS